MITLVGGVEAWTAGGALDSIGAVHCDLLRGIELWCVVVRRGWLDRVWRSLPRCAAGVKGSPESRLGKVCDLFKGAAARLLEGGGETVSDCESLSRSEMQVSVLLRAPIVERRGALEGRGLGAVKEKEEVRFLGAKVSKAEVGRRTETDIDRKKPQ